MRKILLRRWAAILVFVLSLLLLGWANLPVGVVRNQVPMPTIELQLPVKEVVAVLSEQRLISLEYPLQLRTGGVKIVRIRVDMDEHGQITPTAEIGGQAIQGRVISIPNLYDTHNLVLESRLDVAGLQIEPAGSQSEPLRPGRAVSFDWRVHANSPGTFQGSLWLYLNIVPKAGGDVERRTLLAPLIEMRASSFLGLNQYWADGLGVAGLIASSMLGVPFISSWLQQLRQRKTKTGDDEGSHTDWSPLDR